MKCVVGNPGDSRKVTVYTAEWCVHCHEQMPEIKSLAEKAGLRVEEIDVDSDDVEDRRRSRHVRFVPHIDYEGREIDLEDLRELAEQREEEF